MIWSNRCARNVYDTKIYGLRHTGEAMQSSVINDIPGAFVTKCGEKGLQAVLKYCSFNRVHNFNLLSIFELVHMQG